MGWNKPPEYRMSAENTPLLGFCAYGSGAGKTTLLTRLIPALAAHGLRISVIKHAHHTFDIDHPGKDSFRLREAGAVQMLLGSRRRWALMTELDDDFRAEPSLAELRAHMDGTLTDLILVEGFKHEAIPKIEIHRPMLNTPLLADQDKNIIAIASDGPVTTGLPMLDLNDMDAITAFILHWLQEQQAGEKLASVRS